MDDERRLFSQELRRADGETRREGVVE